MCDRLAWESDGLTSPFDHPRSRQKNGNNKKTCHRRKRVSRRCVVIGRGIGDGKRREVKLMCSGLFLFRSRDRFIRPWILFGQRQKESKSHPSLSTAAAAVEVENKTKKEKQRARNMISLTVSDDDVCQTPRVRFLPPKVFFFLAAAVAQVAVASLVVILETTEKHLPGKKE